MVYCPVSYPKHIVLAALQRVSRGQSAHGGQLPLKHWVAERQAARYPLEDLRRFTFSEPTLLSQDPSLCLLSFCFTGSDSQQPTSCLHTAYSSSTDSAGSLVPLAG